MNRILKDGGGISLASGVVMLAALSGVAGCSGSDNNGASPAPAAPAAQATLACDESMKTAFKPDANTAVLLVKAFKKGDPLLLTGSATSDTPVAGNDVCVVKLNVGPGNPGPADAPSTSAGIGIEVWLPSQANWNNRIHIKGGGGWSGTPQASLTVLAGTSADATGSPADTALKEGAVSATVPLL
jgi:feruloyl esterase